MTEIRIGVIGSVDSGKSTITGVITKNILDDGRGKARSLILKHPHEKETGRTSSISQHYLKINNDNLNDYINTDNTDNTNHQEKIINFVDLAGHEKYLKTTINGIKRCLIDYGCIVVGANMGVLHMTREHIALSMALNLPSFVILTKIDIAPKNITENTIININNIFKKYSKKRQVFLVKNDNSFNKLIDLYKTNNKLEINDETNVNSNNKIITQDKIRTNNKNIVPIFPVSSVTGDGINNLKKFINLLTSYSEYESKIDEDVSFIIDCKYMIKGIGLVISGVMSSGTVNKGDTLYLGPLNNSYHKVIIRSIHNNFRENVDTLYAGQGGCFNIKPAINKDFIKRNMINKGMRVVSNPRAYSEFEAEVKVLQHPTTIKINYEPTIHCGGICQSARIIKMKNDYMRVGDKSHVTFKFCYHSEFIDEGDTIIFREGNTKGIGKVIKIIK